MDTMEIVCYRENHDQVEYDKEETMWQLDCVGRVAPLEAGPPLCYSTTRLNWPGPVKPTELLNQLYNL